MGVYSVNLAGESHRNADGTSRQDVIRAARPGQTVRLEREPDNPYDDRAIRVRSVEGGIMGYVAADKAIWMAERIDAGRPCSATIQFIGMAPSGMLGVVLEVSTDDAPAQPLIAEGGAEPGFWASLKGALQEGMEKPVTERRQNGCLTLLTVAAVIGGLAYCADSSQRSTSPPPAPRYTEAQSNACGSTIEGLVRHGTIRRFDPRGSIELRESYWAGIDADGKKKLLIMIDCAAMAGRRGTPMQDVTSADVYGAQSGKRLGHLGAFGYDFD